MQLIPISRFISSRFQSPINIKAYVNMCYDTFIDRKANNNKKNKKKITKANKPNKANNANNAYDATKCKST